MPERTDEDRFDHLVKTFAKQVQTSCTRPLLRRPWLIDDAVARVFELLWSNIKKLPDDDEQVSRWLYITSRNVCTNLYRHFQAELPSDSLFIADRLEHPLNAHDNDPLEPPVWLLDEGNARAFLHRSWLYECMDNVLKEAARALVKHVFALGQGDEGRAHKEPSWQAVAEWLQAQGALEATPDSARMKAKRALEALHACIKQKELRHRLLPGQ